MKPPTLYQTDEEVRIVLSGNTQVDELMWWWFKTSFEDYCKQTPKMLEYGGDLEAQLAAEADLSEGAIDLTIMGIIMTMLLRWKDATGALGKEISVWFYTMGKICRLVSDYHRQKPGKPDTWHDITVYSMMARRIQETGRWP